LFWVFWDAIRIYCGLAEKIPQPRKSPIWLLSVIFFRTSIAASDFRFENWHNHQFISQSIPFSRSCNRLNHFLISLPAWVLISPFIRSLTWVNWDMLKLFKTLIETEHS
jgi:hypothetical protein